MLLVCDCCRYKHGEWLSYPFPVNICAHSISISSFCCNSSSRWYGLNSLNTSTPYLTRRSALLTVKRIRCNRLKTLVFKSDHSQDPLPPIPLPLSTPVTVFQQKERCKNEEWTWQWNIAVLRKRTSNTTAPRQWPYTYHCRRASTVCDGQELVFTYVQWWALNISANQVRMWTDEEWFIINNIPFSEMTGKNRHRLINTGSFFLCFMYYW